MTLIYIIKKIITIKSYKKNNKTLIKRSYWINLNLTQTFNLRIKKPCLIWVTFKGTNFFLTQSYSTHGDLSSLTNTLLVLFLFSVIKTWSLPWETEDILNPSIIGQEWETRYNVWNPKIYSLLKRKTNESKRWSNWVRSLFI